MGPGRPAFVTGGAAAAILRLGFPLDHRDAVVTAIKDGHGTRGDGPRTPALRTSRAATAIMRGLFMLHERPTPPAVAFCPLPEAGRRLCRHAGWAGSLGGAYLGSIITYWSRQLMVLPAVVETAGFTPLVNGDARPAGTATPNSGRPATACSSASRPASITTSSWPPPGRTATSCSRSTSAGRRQRQ